MITITQAKELVRKHPKRIADFTRQRVEPGFLKRTVVVNYVLYNYNSFLGNNWRKALSIGDGNLYGIRFVSTDRGKVGVPNLDLLVYENPFKEEGFFTMSFN
jgi:hypothetical protein